ncbi:glycoside hydrolase family protein [Escherichia coli]|nr:glycoside hydrolase family protein [Escherichia coli]
MKFVAPEQAPEQAEIIRNTPFWPDVDLSEFRSVMRTDGTVTQPRLKQVVWTDGIGNTSGVIPGKTITERQAAEGLISNVLRVERALERCVKQQPPQKVYDAAVSFAFNVGTGNACSSTLVKLLNQRRWADACRQLPRWVYVKGVFNQGLDNRRAREMAWCLQGAN